MMDVTSRTGSSSFQAIIGCSYCSLFSAVQCFMEFCLLILNFGYDVLNSTAYVFVYPLDIFLP